MAQPSIGIIDDQHGQQKSARTTKEEKGRGTESWTEPFALAQLVGEDPAFMAVKRKIVSVTPLDLDLTHGGLLERLPGWKLPGFEAILEQEGAGR